MHLEDLINIVMKVSIQQELFLVENPSNSFHLVYNRVAKLNLVTRQWTSVDNFGEIPSVRMGNNSSQIYQSIHK